MKQPLHLNQHRHTHRKRTAVATALGFAALVGIGAAYAAVGKQEGDTIIHQAQDVVEARSSEAAAKMDANYHATMADHYDAKVSATDSLGGKISNKAKAVTEDVKAGIDNTKAGYHQAKGDAAEKELVKTISQTIN
jgi:hypothetical protein